MDVVQERDGSNAVTANYTRSGNIGGLLARSTSAGHFYYHYDGGGNVMQLTDANQATVAQYSYDAYGVLISAGGLQSGQPYRFSTKEYHDYSGLYDYGYRFYSPNLGRWLNRDPIEESGGLNLYAMVGNDPVNKVDEYGLVTTIVGVVVLHPITGKKTKLLKITLPVTFVGGHSDGMTKQSVINIIEKTWTGDYGDVLVGVDVVETEPSKPTNTVHLRGGKGRSEAETGGDDMFLYPSSPNNNGPLGSAAHEAGHIIGLGDRYDDILDAKGNVVGFKPHEGYADSIMGDASKRPSRKTIQEIIEIHKIKFK